MTMYKNVNGVTLELTSAEVAEYEAEQARVNIPTVPQVVTMRQARRALLDAGKLTIVNSAIAAMVGAQGDQARIDWEFSGEVQRAQPLVSALAPVLGMTSEEIDQLFIVAAGIK